MSVANAGRFSCDACGKSYSWKAQLAGRWVKCKCGGVMTVPASDPAAVEDALPPDFEDLYALADGTPVPEAVTPPAFTRGTASGGGGGAALALSMGDGGGVGSRVIGKAPVRRSRSIMPSPSARPTVAASRRLVGFSASV